MLGAVNYYRNYHLRNNIVETCYNNYKSYEFAPQDKDFLENNLKSEQDLKKFFEDDHVYIKKYVLYFQKWARQFLQLLKK